MRGHDRFLRAALLSTLTVWACGGEVSDDGPRPEAFDDHTVTTLASAADYHARAATRGGRGVVKFIITNFGDDERRATRFLDSNFFRLHDEWYWFRLLNGQRVEGVNETPFIGPRFSTIEAIYAWAKMQSSLPLDLRWTLDDRLYSPNFYTVALTPPRALGLGAIIHVAATADRPQRWVFELEYSEIVDHRTLVLFFEALQSGLPDDVAEELHWVIRSPQQEKIAQRIEAMKLKYHDRIIRYRELAVPGETEVYNPGLTAGRVKVIRDDGDLQRTSANDIIVLETVPDWLPPASALLSATPQTPLAHVNVLARNRGIPNVYRGGVLDDPTVDQLSRVSAPAIVRAATPDRLELVPIEEHQYANWLTRQTAVVRAVPYVDTSTMPYTVDLSQLGLRDVERVRPIIGGKAAGFLALMDPGDVPVPDRPLAITIRPFVEHLAGFTRSIEAALASEAFKGASRTRFLVLEGPTRFARRYTTAADVDFAAGFSAAHPEGDALGDLVRLGGVVDAIRNLPVDAATLATITDALSRHFAGYAASQGLRFRSSSTVEDVEGFNGAGLYDSNTGFLDAAAQSTERDRGRTVQRALVRTWSSYWGFEAFEERRRENIEHLTGNMAVLVHARFDDPLEVNNGVFTFTIFPPGQPDVARLEVNVQKGAVSVTNPEPGSGALPEVDRVRQPAGGADLTVERVRRSTLAAATEDLLTDEELRALFDQARRVTQAWLTEESRGLEEAQRSRTLTLDFEMRKMAAGWPRLDVGPPFAERIVIKQARSLEPGLGRVLPTVRDEPLPRDVLARARRVERWTCASSSLQTTAVEAYTNPLIEPDLGHGDDPFTGSLQVEVLEDLPDAGLTAGTTLEVLHPRFAAVRHPEIDADTWSVDVTTSTQAELQRLTVAADGAWTLQTADGTSTGAGLSCAAELLHSTPDDYLRSLLPRSNDGS